MTQTSYTWFEDPFWEKIDICLKKVGLYMALNSIENTSLCQVLSSKTIAKKGVVVLCTF